MFLAYLSQMIGLDDIDPSVSAFLTSLYVVFTAVISSVYHLRLPTKIMILGVGLATFGAGLSKAPTPSWELQNSLQYSVPFYCTPHLIHSTHNH